MSRRVEPGGPELVLARALASLAGAALVLDRELNIVLATAEAEALIGAAIRPGMPAVKVLCARSPKRELAEALVAGRSISAVIPHPRRADGTRTLRVRAIVLRDADRLVGFVLLVDEGAAFSGWHIAARCS